MEVQNLILVFDEGCNRILMCKRSKAPYQGLLNLVGGKVEAGEDILAAAYRELQEETSITKDSITLQHLLDLTYYIHNRKLEVYAGRLKENIQVSGEENKLFWLPVQDIHCASGLMAGEGNVVHIVEYALHLTETNRLKLE